MQFVGFTAVREYALRAPQKDGELDGNAEPLAKVITEFLLKRDEQPHGRPGYIFIIANVRMGTHGLPACGVTVHAELSAFELRGMGWWAACPPLTFVSAGMPGVVGKR